MRFGYKTQELLESRGQRRGKNNWKRESGKYKYREKKKKGVINPSKKLGKEMTDSSNSEQHWFESCAGRHEPQSMMQMQLNKIIGFSLWPFQSVILLMCFYGGVSNMSKQGQCCT